MRKKTGAKIMGLHIMIMGKDGREVHPENWDEGRMSGDEALADLIYRLPHHERVNFSRDREVRPESPLALRDHMISLYPENRDRWERLAGILLFNEDYFLYFSY